MLDNILRYEYLRKLLDWYIGYNYHWQVETGALGKKYKGLLSKEDWQDYESILVGSGIEENWQGLLNLTAFFRRVAIFLSETLGYVYPIRRD